MHFSTGLNRISFLASSGILALAAPAMAQTAAAAPADQVAEEGGIGEIIVTAQRRSQRLTEVPISIQAVDAATIDRVGIASSTDFLKLTPSVNFVSGFAPAATSVTIRGVSSIAQEGGIQPSTAVVVDDVPLARQGEFVNDFNDIERIEVLRGAQGTLFGKNATAGVINIINKRPTNKYEGRIEGGYSTDNEKLIRGMINIPLGEGIRVRTNAFYRNLPGVIDNKATLVNGSNYEKTSGDRNYGISTKVAIDLSDNVDLLLSGDYVRQTSSFGANVILVPDTVPFFAASQIAAGVVANPNKPFVNSDNPSFSESRSYGFSASLDVRLSDDLTLKSTTAYRHYKYDANTDADGGPWGGWSGVGLLPNPFGYPFNYVVTPKGGIPRAPDVTKYASQEIRLVYSKDQFDIVGGFFGQWLDNKRHNSVPFILNFGVPSYLNNSIDSKISDNIVSAFADVTYKFTDTLSVFGGLRYSVEKLKVDYHRDSWFGLPTDTFDPVTLLPTVAPDRVVDYSADKTQKNLSGRIGLRFAPDRLTSYYASYSRGYKGPAVDVSRVAEAVTAFVKPELADAFEIGTKHILFNNKVTANLAVFHQTVKDVQQSSLISGTTESRLQNAGNLRSYGVELDIAAQVTDAFRIDGGLAWVKAEYRNFINSCYIGQTAALGCNIDGNNDGVFDSQDETGVRATGQPRFAANISGVYSITLPENVPFDSFVRLGVGYKSSIPFGLNGDPLLVQTRYALVDAQVGFTGKENGWQLLFYVKNLTNKAYASKKTEADNFIARVFANYGRDYKRYGGVMLKATF